MSTPIPDSPAPAPETSGGCGCGDPHDHAGHDHPPTGADVVRALVPALSIVSLAIPALGVIMILSILAYAPSTPWPILIGLSLGALQLLSLVATSLYVARTRVQLAVNPGLLAVRSVVDELLRLAAVWSATLLWPADVRGPLAVWVGAGTALVWVVLATAQSLRTRSRIAKPSQWSTEAVATLLNEGVGVRRSMVLRVLDVAGTITFQLGATILVMLSPAMVVATVVLSIATGLSTLVLQRRSPSQRARSPWALAPVGIGLLVLVLAVLALGA
ncbi:hypothetical protein BF93_01990 [Brachybacterium phenoliresistens]|uniref:Uncharacterized protein n=1 Tax=Brachybacterium phenoliresistens TaxID=396014 RepID=Z9JQH1_9MICO|nr:hypothetical protein [Brachybacterium phenoliresistens]EWS80645.1 hypothetical protein BF93_01990 [Brachybacterium phenoliresistens]